MEKSWKFQGGGGSKAKPSGMENPVGWGVKLEKTLRGRGMDIFWNHTFFLRGNHEILFLNVRPLNIPYLFSLLTRDSLFCFQPQSSVWKLLDFFKFAILFNVILSVKLLIIVIINAINYFSFGVMEQKMTGHLEFLVR